MEKTFIKEVTLKLTEFGRSRMFIGGECRKALLDGKTKMS